MVQIWVVMVTILPRAELMWLFLVGLSGRQNLQQQSTHNRKAETIFQLHWSASRKKLQVQLCEISDISCRWSWMLMVHILKICLQECQSSKASELRGYNVETKMQYSQSVGKNSLIPKKVLHVRSNVKVMLTVFLDIEGLCIMNSYVRSKQWIASIILKCWNIYEKM
jgi:hypothetical protein